MSLLIYKQVRPYAAAIKEAVALRKMPLWFADPHYGKFSNDRSLPQAKIDTIVSSVKAGAPEGDPSDAPKPKEFVEGWNIVNPDVVLEMPGTFSVPATATIEYHNPWNPDPTKEVKWGEQSWDEMMIGFFDVAIPKDMDVSKLLVEKKKKKTEAAAIPKKPVT